MSAVGYIGGSASDVGEGGDTAHAMRAYATAGVIVRPVDRVVKIRPFRAAFLSFPATIGKTLIIDIPPAQPKTLKHGYVPAPDIVANVARAAAYSASLPLWDHDADVIVLATLKWIRPLVATGTIGDWGKAADWYPDIPSCTKPQIWHRRLGANFNFGAMAAALGWSLNDTLIGAAGIGGWHHPKDEQEAIELGWNWYTDGGPTLPFGSSTAVSIPDPYFIYPTIK